MSFLDNLENSLKNLENREEKSADEGKRREADRQRALAVAPWAEKLKQSGYARELMQQMTRAGHALRTKIYMSWLASNLRFEARGQRLELRPTPDGIVAVFIAQEGETRSAPVDLDGDPAALVQEWIDVIAVAG